LANAEKLFAIKNLILKLMWQNYYPQMELTKENLMTAHYSNGFSFGRVFYSQLYACDYKHQTIYLSDNNPSIISALHEFGHYLYGKSELKACRFSVHLFKEIFPIAYKKLKWEGHMLK